jgi:hypothetical protein
MPPQSTSSSSLIAAVNTSGCSYLLADRGDEEIPSSCPGRPQWRRRASAAVASDRGDLGGSKEVRFLPCRLPAPSPARHVTEHRPVGRRANRGPEDSVASSMARRSPDGSPRHTRQRGGHDVVIGHQLGDETDRRLASLTSLTSRCRFVAAGRSGMTHRRRSPQRAPSGEPIHRLRRAMPVTMIASGLPRSGLCLVP